MCVNEATACACACVVCVCVSACVRACVRVSPPESSQLPMVFSHLGGRGGQVIRECLLAPDTPDDSGDSDEAEDADRSGD